jgi:YD repeat-containing protein
VHKIDYTTNRLASITNGPAKFSFVYGYDSQGNITSRGAQTYVFDLANRMTAALGRATYVYDGLGRRVSVVGTDGVNRIQVYSQAGQLLYVAPSGGSGTKYIYLHNHQIAEVK